ncbi:conserved hypothetical protein [Burkholderiales bacterium 8X]|nr:conserved hypothetical protein [Burkholderiales bacterium 8X]
MSEKTDQGVPGSLTCSPGCDIPRGSRIGEGRRVQAAAAAEPRRMPRTASALISTAMALASLSAMGLHAAAATAATWRCGNAYSDRPCMGGAEVDAADPRSHQQRREADGDARSARTAADRLERERVRDEVQGARRGATILGDHRVEARAPEPVRGRKKGSKSSLEARNDFTAHDPVATARNKAARKASKASKNADKS